MKVKFWGVRGSIPVPGPKTVRYGGNTTCIEVRTSDNQLIILDAGTGIYPLSVALVDELPVRAHIFNTHTHWDHIQGLPYFIPLFLPENKVTIYGAFDPVSQTSISEILSVQMQHRFFPVSEVELQADIGFRTLREQEKIKIGNATVTPYLMNHPVVNYGYRIEDNGKSMFFTGDHEPPYNSSISKGAAYKKDEAALAALRESIVESIRDVDVLIADAAYTKQEYPAKQGWGHGTFDSSIRLAQQAGAKHLYCTHHEPNRDDDSLERVFAEALEQREHFEDEPEYFLAREGLTIEV